MSYMENVEETSNASVLDICLIDELSEKFENEEKIKPEDIINLARIIETFILNNEVVVKNNFGVFNEFEGSTENDNYSYNYDFTKSWIETFYENHVIQDSSTKSASKLFGQESLDYELENIRKIRKYKDKEELDDYFYKFSLYENQISNDAEMLQFEIQQDDERDRRERFWKNTTKYYGVPYITDNLYSASKDLNRYTNISIDLYERMKEYYKGYFSDISRYLGPTYVMIPPFLSMVLENVNGIEDIPKITMQIRDRFSEFVMEVTEMEYQLKMPKPMKEKNKILNDIEFCYNSIVEKKQKPKKRVISRVFDCVQTLDVKGAASNAFEQIREMNVEKNGLLLIPGYYDMWNATEEVEDAFYLLKKVFGKQIDDDFLMKLHKFSI